NAEREIARGATGNLEDFQRLGLRPKGLPELFASEPASVQERWFARMYLLKSAIFVVLSLLWISTAYVSLGPGWDYGVGLMREGGVEGSGAALTVVAGALADLVIGLAIAYRPTSRYGLYAAIVISFTYAIIGTILVPRLWADPFWGGWMVWSFMMYVLTGALWLPVVWMQMPLRDLASTAAAEGSPLPNEYHRIFGLWFAFGIPAFIAVAAILWLMIAKPQLALFRLW